MTPLHELVPLLFVEDVDRSLAFYRDQLGFDVTQTWEPADRIEWCRIERNGVAVMLQRACEGDGPAEGHGRGVAFYFHCEDATAEYERLTAAGIEVEPPTVAFYGMKQLFVSDADGYELCFQNEVQSTEVS